MFLIKQRKLENIKITEPSSVKNGLNPFPNKPFVFTREQYKSLENTVGKGEIARNEQFLLFPQCFLPVWRAVCYFHKIWNCRLGTVSVRKSLKFVVWERVNISAEVRGENTPERKVASTGDRTHNHQVMSPTRSLLSQPGGAPELCDDLLKLFTKRQNFRLVKIESICRRQSKFGWKIGICFGKGRKHCGKKRDCWLPAFSPFPTMFPKGFSYRVVKSGDCVVKELRYDGIIIEMH